MLDAELPYPIGQNIAGLDGIKRNIAAPVIAGKLAVHPVRDEQVGIIIAIQASVHCPAHLYYLLPVRRLHGNLSERVYVPPIEVGTVDSHPRPTAV